MTWQCKDCDDRGLVPTKTGQAFCSCDKGRAKMRWARMTPYERALEEKEREKEKSEARR